MTTEYFHMKKNAVFVQRDDKGFYILHNVKHVLFLHRKDTVGICDD